MKKCLIAFSFLLLFNPTFSQDIEKIKQVLESQRQAWNAGDLETYMQGYWNTDSLLFVGKNGPKYGWKQTLENYRKSYPDKAAMGELHFDIKKVELLNARTAFVLGAWRLKREKDEPKGYFTLILKKLKGQWLIVSDHSS
jgi:uncharacterized protein (TIGR02246 family)